MTMRKRILAIVLAMTCVLGAVACGEEKPVQTQMPSTDEVNEITDGNETSEASGIKEGEQQVEPIIEDKKEKRPTVDPSLITYADSYQFDKIVFNQGEKADVDIRVEAEKANSAEGVIVKTDSASSGGEYVDITNNKDFALTVEIPASQFYKISVSHKAGSHKENPILFNGAKVCDVYSEKGDWVVSTYDGVYLEKGKNNITLGEGWSWFSLDYIHIESGTTISDDFYNQENRLLTNPYANLKSQNIYQYLQAVYGKRTLAG